MAIHSSSNRLHHPATRSVDVTGAPTSSPSPSPSLSGVAGTNASLPTTSGTPSDAFDSANGPSGLFAAVALAASANVSALESMQLVSRHKLAGKGVSGLVAVGEKTWITLDDNKGIQLLHGKKGQENLLTTKKHKKLRDLEGLCLAPDGNSIYVVSESTKKVYSLSLDEKDGQFELGDPKHLGKLPKLDNVKNKGWEGLSVLPGKFSADGKERLVAVHEGYPRRLGIFTLPDVKTETLLKIPKAAKKLMPDLSDVAVHPETGNLFVVSDVGAVVVEFSLETETKPQAGGLVERPVLKMLGDMVLDVKRDQKPEAVTFKSNGNMLVATDGRPVLMEFAPNS